VPRTRTPNGTKKTGTVRDTSGRRTEPEGLWRFCCAQSKHAGDPEPSKNRSYPPFSGLFPCLSVCNSSMYFPFLSSGIYPMYMSSSYIYHVYELIKFMKNLKNTQVLFILLHLYIKFEVKTHYNLSIIKKRNF
jgi:hypothetical protein